MKSQKHNAYAPREDGYTLVEIMIAMVISSIVLGAMYATYTIQRKSHGIQVSTAEMQQNVRAAMQLLTSDLRMAGYDPTFTGSFGFNAATTFNNGDSLSEAVTTSAITLAFTMDLDEDGTLDRDAEDVNGDGHIDMNEIEQVAYRLNTTNQTLQRYSTTSGVIEWQIVAENIEAVDFNFLDANGNNIASINATTVNNISMVQIALLVHSEGITEYQDTTIYDLPWQAGWQGPFNDNFQRRLLVHSVQMRNM